MTTVQAAEFEAVCASDAPVSNFCHAHPYKRIALSTAELNNPLYGVTAWDANNNNFSIKQQYIIARACASINDCREQMLNNQKQPYTQLLAIIANDARGNDWATRILNISANTPLKVIADADNQLPVEVLTFARSANHTRERQVIYYRPTTTPEEIAAYQAAQFERVKYRSTTEN